MNDERVCTILNTLIEVVRDGMEFYAAMANKVSGNGLRKLLHHMVEIRADIIGELSSRVDARGGTPSSRGTMGGALSEIRAKAKAADRADDDIARLISSLEVFDNRILEEMRSATLKDLPDQERPMLLRQTSRISKGLSVMQRLKNAPV